MKSLFIYLTLINALGFTLMLIDKEKAKKSLWRIPEVTLFTVSLLGGSFGCLAGMYAVRHKTKQPKFTIGIPIILCVQVMLLVILYGNTVGS